MPDSARVASSRLTFIWAMSRVMITLAASRMGRLWEMVSTFTSISDRRFSAVESTPISWLSCMEITALRPASPLSGL